MAFKIFVEKVAMLRIWSHLLKISLMENLIFICHLNCYFRLKDKECSLGLRAFQRTELYSEPYQTSKMERFAKTLFLNSVAVLLNFFMK